jgi:ribonuclease VapC
VIVLDTSALVAILKGEVEAGSFLQIIVDEDRCLLSAVGLFEASMVMIGRGPAAAANDLDALVRRRGIEVVPFDEEQARQSRAAFVRYGKGRHPAALNFGDCAAYALASRSGCRCCSRERISQRRT